MRQLWETEEMVKEDTPNNVFKPTSLWGPTIKGPSGSQNHHHHTPPPGHHLRHHHSSHDPPGTSCHVGSKLCQRSTPLKYPGHQLSGREAGGVHVVWCTARALVSKMTATGSLDRWIRHGYMGNSVI